MNIRPLLYALLIAPSTVAFAETHQQQEMSAEEKAMMEAYQNAATPGPEHARMAEKVGSYTLEMTNFPPGAEPVKESGNATRRMTLGGRVMVEEVDASMMGSRFNGYGMTGYDNVSGRYWSTWNDSMSTGIMISDGSCDAAGACEFKGSWNDPLTKGKTHVRMNTRWNDGTEVFEMYGPGPDGKEMRMMEIIYKRVTAQ